MAEKISDGQDQFLATVFQSAPIPDDGFSDRIVSRVRRRIWVNRLALPIAVFVGAAFAIKPAAQLVAALLPLLSILPVELVDAPMRYLPQLQTVVLGGMTLAIGIALFKVFEET